MALGATGRSGGSIGVSTLILEDFSGGWNPRDAPSQVADNESPDCVNVTLDERGGVMKRLGLERLGTGTTLTGAPINVFFWQKTGETIVQDSATVYKTSDFANFTSLKTYTTNARAAFCDFQGKLVAIHPADRVATYDGATWTDIGTTSPKGASIAVWQNKVWASSDPDNVSRVYASAAGDPATWTTGTDFIDVREKDNAAVTALGAGQGMDVSGRPGLLVFKSHSVYRINVSASGASFGQYTTLHNEAGAAGAMCVATSTDGTICFIGVDGIFATDGVAKPKLVSAKLEPLFRAVELNFAQASNWCAGTIADRVVFSVSRGEATNNLTLEYSPQVGWIVPHDFGLSAMTSFQQNDYKLYGGAPAAGKIYDVFQGGTDDGTAISARYSTRWFEPGFGYEVRLRRVRVRARGRFTIDARVNWSEGQGSAHVFTPTPAATLWNGTTWNGGTWANEAYEESSDFFSLGHGRSVTFEISESSSTSATGPKLLRDGTSPEIGAFSFYGLTLDFIRLGYA